MTKKTLDKQCGIYGLAECGEIKYVGQSKDIQKRYKQHCSLAQNQSNTKRQNWLRNMLMCGKLPDLQIIELTKDLDAREILWIEYYKSIGTSLMNLAKGGKDIPHYKTIQPQVPEPWGNKHSPLHFVLKSIRTDINVLKRWGAPKDAIRKLEENYECIQAAIKTFGRSYLNQKLYEKWRGVKHGY